MKKIIGFLAVIIVLFIAIFVVNKMQQTDRSKDNPYGKNTLHPETVELLGNPNYDNIITPDALKEKLKSEEDVYVYFFSPLCDYCMETSPILSEVTKELNVDLPKFSMLEFEHGWQDYDIESIPAVVHFKNGKEVNRIVGGQDKETLIKWFNDNK